MALAQKELSLIQKGLLAKKLAGPDLPLLEVAQLCDAARPRPVRLDRLDLRLPEAVQLCDVAEPRLIRPGQPDS